MSFKRILASGIIGTSAMSGFSYALSARKHRQFREPQLLKKVLAHAGIRKQKTIKAWIIHYGTGIIFTSLYHQLWKRKKSEPKIAEGALLGAISGLIGIMVWRSVLNSLFLLRPFHRRSYYFQLLIAHIIFGITATATYKTKVQNSIS